MPRIPQPIAHARLYSTRCLSPPVLLFTPVHRPNLYSTDSRSVAQLPPFLRSQSTLVAAPPALLAILGRLGRVPPICPGCGAPSQMIAPGKPGYYGREHEGRSTKSLRRKEEWSKKQARIDEDNAWQANMERYQRLLEEIQMKMQRGGGIQGNGAPQAKNGLGVEQGGETRKLSELKGENSVPQAEESGGIDKRELSEHIGEEEDKFASELGLNDDDSTFRITDTSTSSALSGEPMATYIPTPDAPGPTHSQIDRPMPVCERCVQLKLHTKGLPNVELSLKAYPDLNTLVELISESKHERNHIYHLIDAADYPLSLIPSLRPYLMQYLPPSKARRLTVSYIVTRADLLMPKETQVTSLMTYWKSVMKAALPPGETIEGHRDPRGGTFRVISVRNGWSIELVKSELSKMVGEKVKSSDRRVKQREGGIWIVGKVNVGKSRFLREVVPRGSYTVLDKIVQPSVPLPKLPDFDINSLSGQEKVQAFLKQLEENEKAKNPNITQQALDKILDTTRIRIVNTNLSVEELPLAKPTVSQVPGTTVNPIRVALRNPMVLGKNQGVCGEIIDLPGFERGSFLNFVRPECKKYVLMEERVDPLQYVVKPKQSMLIAGLILIQPRTDELVFMMYPYMKLPVHVASTDKCRMNMWHPKPDESPEIQLYQHEPNPEMFKEYLIKSHKVAEKLSGTESDGPHNHLGNFEMLPTWRGCPNILPPHITSAGTFRLTNDVTVQRNPRLSGTPEAGLEQLPYKSYSIDILLEGIGWVEIVSEVRGRHMQSNIMPEVEVFTPLGTAAGSRVPMGADALRMKGLLEMGKFNERRIETRGKRRESAKGEKKEAKRRHRAAIQLHGA